MTFVYLNDEQNKKIKSYTNLIYWFFEELYKAKFQIDVCIWIFESASLEKRSMNELYWANEQLFIINMFQLLEFKERVLCSSNVDKFSIFESIYRRYRDDSKMIRCDSLKVWIKNATNIFKDCYDAELDDIRHTVWHINFINISSNTSFEYIKWNYGVVWPMRTVAKRFNEISKICISLLEEYANEYIAPIFPDWKIPIHESVEHCANYWEKQWHNKLQKFQKWLS